MLMLKHEAQCLLLIFFLLFRLTDNIVLIFRKRFISLTPDSDFLFRQK